jgi:hypothetical protein
VSISRTNYNTFLTYKIEREVVGSYLDDTTTAIAALSGQGADMYGFQLMVEPSKFEYLQSAKRGIMRKLRMNNATPEEMRDRIEGKLRQNYIYNLSFDTIHDTAKFNVMLELEPKTRSAIALEYILSSRTLRLITLY